MSIKCQSCGSVNDDGKQFCYNCGSPIGVAAPSPAPQQVYVQTNVPVQGEQPVSVLGWIGYLILMCIPVVNLITLIVVLCSGKNKTLKNWFIAQILLAVIGIVIAIIIVAVLGVSMNEMLQSA